MLDKDNFFSPVRFGYACKWIDPSPGTDKKKNAEIVSQMNFKGTTKKYLESLKCKDKQFKKVQDIIIHNIQALQNQILWLSDKPIHVRMLRIGSDLLPFYTLPEFYWIYKDQSLLNLIEKGLFLAGEMARINGIRLSMHPGQFCILNSANPDVVDRSVEEFEYHCDIMRWMGFSGWHPYGMEINVHGGSGKEGVEPLIKTITTRLSEDARNWISIENCEYSFGIEDLAPLSDICALVLDVHHHYIHSRGDYINPCDKRLQPFIDSWRGIIPEMHYSISPEYLLEGHSLSTKPNFSALLEAGISRSLLRKHSNMSWNIATNDWVLEFTQNFDIMVEAKNKNLASFQLYSQALDKSYQSTILIYR